MKIPRDVSADDLIKMLSKLGYSISRQKGSHIRLTSKIKNEEHHITIPNHSPLKIGTLNNILNDIAEKNKITKEELINLF